MKAHAGERNIDPAWFEHNAVHLHVPEGRPQGRPVAGIDDGGPHSLVTGQVMAPNLP